MWVHCDKYQQCDQTYQDTDRTHDICIQILQQFMSVQDEWRENLIRWHRFLSWQCHQTILHIWFLIELNISQRDRFILTDRFITNKSIHWSICDLHC
jgi:hypothetical protein